METIEIKDLKAAFAELRRLKNQAFKQDLAREAINKRFVGARLSDALFATLAHKLITYHVDNDMPLTELLDITSDKYAVGSSGIVNIDDAPINWLLDALFLIVQSNLNLRFIQISRYVYRIKLIAFPLKAASRFKAGKRSNN